MANFDKLIEMMAQRSVERAVLIGGQRMQVFIGGQQSEGSVMPVETLRQYLLEVTPENLRPQIEAGGSLQFLYYSPQGPYEVSVDTLFDAFQVTLAPNKPQHIVPANNSASDSAPLPLVPQESLAVAPQEVVSQEVPAPVVNQQRTFCQKCGTPNALGASFCSGCGNSLNMATAPIYTEAAPPQQAPNLVNVTVQQKNSNAGWWAATAVMLYGTPLGCIAIPVTLILLAFAFTAGIAFSPTIVAVIAAVVVGKHPSIAKNRKLPIIAALLVVGIGANAVMFSQKTTPSSDATTALSSDVGALDSVSSAPQVAAKPADFSISAIQLFTEYNDNLVAADGKYKDKILSVTGTVDSIGKDPFDESPYLTLETGIPVARVRCAFYKKDNSRIAQLKKGDEVTVRGTCEGRDILNINITYASFDNDTAGSQTAETSQVDTSNNSDTSDNSSETTPPSWEGERFPQTRLTYLSESDIADWDSTDVRYALNEIYARHGLSFKSKNLKQQFGKTAWYRPMSGRSMSQIEKLLSAKEKANVGLLSVKRDQSSSSDSVSSESAATETTTEPSAKADVLQTVDKWRSAWESQDVDVYMANYTADAQIFSNKKWYSYGEYAEHERELFSHGGTIKITRGKTQVNIEGDTATVSFPLTFQRQGGKGDYRSRGRQKFKLRRNEAGSWEIYEDVFSK